MKIRTQSCGWIRFSALAVLAVVAIALAPSGHAQTKPAAKTASVKKAAAETLPAPMKTFGVKSAPITMEVFSDYQCPACRSFFENTLRFMITDYVASGKVYLVHRDFPLPMHPYSMDAARWANAAARIGRFESVDTALFDTQNNWTKDGNMEQYISAALGTSDFKRVQKLVQGCLTQTVGGQAAQTTHSCELDSFIAQDQVLGKAVPVNSTPTIVITYKGQRYPPMSGIFTWPIMKQYLDSLMSQ